MKFSNFTKFLASAIFGLSVVSVCSSCTPSDGDKYKTMEDLYTEEQLLDLTTRISSGENGVVAAANPYAAHAGLKVLAAGGNAFDAAIAVSFALGVVEPHCSSIGGGGILVGFDATRKKFVSYNFREFVPETGNASVYRNAAEFDDGVRSIGMPTQVQSLLTIMDEYGNWGNTEEGRHYVITPAKELAANGFKVTEELYNAYKDESCWKTDAQGREIFGKNGKSVAKRVGETIVNTNLANVYNEIIEKGADGFYKGWVKDAILDAAGVNATSTVTTDEGATYEVNGLLTENDFEYAVENYPLECEPTQTTYRDYKVVSSAPPSSGGLILAESLNMIEAYEEIYDQSYTTLGHNSPEYINLISTVEQLAYGDKQKWIGDDKFYNVPKKGLINKDYAYARLEENYTPGSQYNGKYSQTVTGGITSKNGFTNSSVTDEATVSGGTVAGQNYGRADWYDEDYQDRYAKQTSATIVDPTDNDEHFSTTSFSVADKDGNIVTITQTINHFFGSHIMPEGCGFYLNNQLGSFTIAKSTNASYVYPHKNPTSHIMPTIILDSNNNAVATLGSPGSMRLVSACLNTVLNMIDWHYEAETGWTPRTEGQELQIQEAIEGARIYSYCVSTSDDDWDENVRDAAEREAHKTLWLEVESTSDTKATKVAKSDITAETAQIMGDTYGYYVCQYSGRNLFFGGVQGITFDSLGVMHGGADIRRDGKALGF